MQIKKLASLSVDESYPARNRLLNPDIDGDKIKIAFDSGYAMGTYREILNTLTLGELELGSPLQVPGCDIGAGDLAYVYQTSEVSLWLSPEALVRMIVKNLSSDEYFRLRDRYGIFYEISSSFYDPQSGDAFEPLNVAEEKILTQFK